MIWRPCISRNPICLHREAHLFAPAPKVRMREYGQLRASGTANRLSGNRVNYGLDRYQRGGSWSIVKTLTCRSFSTRGGIRGRAWFSAITWRKQATGLLC